MQFANLIPSKVETLHRNYVQVFKMANPVHLHPLTLLNISDHKTRLAVRAAPGTPVVASGVLLGCYSSTLEVHTSFACPTTVSDAVCFDLEFLKQLRDQFAQVFPQYEPVGWYSTDPDVATSVVIGRQFTVDLAIPAPISLLLDPIRVFEGSVSRPFSLVSGDAERVGIEHISRTGSGVGSANAPCVSQLKSSVGTFQQSMRMLNLRISRICEFLESSISAAKAADVQSVDTRSWLMDNAEMLRKVSLIALQLQNMTSENYEREYAEIAAAGLVDLLLVSSSHAVSRIGEMSRTLPRQLTQTASVTSTGVQDSDDEDDHDDE